MNKQLGCLFIENSSRAFEPILDKHVHPLVSLLMTGFEKRPFPNFLLASKTLVGILGINFVTTFQELLFRISTIAMTEFSKGLADNGDILQEYFDLLVRVF